ncbi:hypothetical protein D9C73_015389 [Collichthys lucidus]|uniref:Uncharacterized protein n=1 Tax=Collichthys lucidus TaxID=240159 RepID=A0A4U5V0T8_COLLU|nr:hypothetical protein D9C73_015389 [Collichthys lucidus]
MKRGQQHAADAGEGKTESRQSRVAAKQSRSKAESQQSSSGWRRQCPSPPTAGKYKITLAILQLSLRGGGGQAGMYLTCGSVVTGVWEARGALREAAVTADYHHPRSRRQSVQVSSARRVVSGRRQRRRRQRKRGGRKWACPRAKEPRGHQEGHCIPI